MLKTSCIQAISTPHTGCPLENKSIADVFKEKGKYLGVVFSEIAKILCQRQQAASIIRAALAAIAHGDFPVPGSSILIK